MKMKDVLEIRHLRIAQVLEQSACRLDGGLHGAVQTQRVKAADREVTEQPFFGRTRAEGGGRIALNKAVRFSAQRVRRVGDDLAGRGGGKGAGEIPPRVRQVPDVKFARRHIAKGQPGLFSRNEHGAQKVVGPLIQGGIIADRAGRHHPHDLALDQALGKGWVFRLLADGHLVALGDQPGQVGIHRMIGHPAHGRALGQAAVPPRQGQFQLPAGQQRVIKEHLIKIPEAVEHNRVRVLLLDFHILLHHRGELGHDTLLRLTLYDF